MLNINDAYTDPIHTSGAVIFSYLITVYIHIMHSDLN